jgi:excisionase family DNA binding protein
MPVTVDTTYTPEEVANATDRNIHTIYRNLRSGKLEGEKFGGEWIVTDEALQEWLPAPIYREHFAKDEA